MIKDEQISEPSSLAAATPDQGHPKAQDHGGGPLHKLRHHSLKLAGASFLLADSAFITSSFLREAKSKSIGLAGVLGLTEGAIGARYGNPKAEKQLQQLEHHLGAYLKKQGVEIPKDATTEELTKRGGVWDHVESFLYAYPSQVMTALYSLIGASMFNDGKNMVSSGRRALEDSKLTPVSFEEKQRILGSIKAGKSMRISGSLMGAAALAGLLIPEKKPDPEHPPAGVTGKLLSWVQERPLRVTGLLMNANQVFLGKYAYDLYKTEGEKNKAWLFTAITVAGFVMGNTLLALSSKEYDSGGKLNPKTLNSLAEASAAVILAQPKELQDALVEHIAGFLSTRPNVPMKAADLSRLLHAKLDEMAKAPPKENWQARLEAKSDPALPPAR